MKKRAKIKKKENFLIYVNPKKMNAKIEQLGFALETKKYVMTILAALTCVVVIGQLLGLQWGYVLALGVFTIATLPLFIIDIYKQKYNKQKFMDATNYVEAVLNEFIKNRKILSALEETLKQFPKGKMHDAIQDAIFYISSGEGDNANIYLEGLRIIERAYPSKRIINAHNLMNTTELDGGDYIKACRILLDDKRIWYNVTTNLMKEKQKMYGDVLICAICAAALCIFTNNTYTNLPAVLNIVGHPLVQIITLVMMILLVLIIKWTSTCLNTDWVESDSFNENKDMIREFNELMNYDFEKNRVKSIIPTVTCGICAVLSAVLGMKFLAFGLLVLGAFFLMAKRLHFRALYNHVEKAIRQAFPVWLIQLTLLLQHNNVSNSLRISLDFAPDVLKPEIEALLVRIRDNPSKLDTYTDFLKYFEIDEITNTMKSLYSISESGFGNMDSQMQSLLDTNLYMQEKAEEIQANEHKLSIKNKFMLPMATVSIKLMVDLMIFILVALPAMSQLI